VSRARPGPRSEPFDPPVVGSPEEVEMHHNQYRLSVSFMPPLPPARRRRRAGSASPPAGRPREMKVSYDSALRGVLTGIPIAVLLWVPILWCLLHIG
jgi:hypothetical protein